MHLTYDPTVDAASVEVRGPIAPGGDHHKERLDADRFVRYADDDGAVLAYEFLNVRRHGVRLDDLEHRDELARLFHEAGVAERDWGEPIPTRRRALPPAETAAAIERWRAGRAAGASGR